MAMRIVPLVLPALLAWAGPAAADRANPLGGCAEALSAGTAETVACVADFDLSADLRDEVAGLTGGLVRDVACQMHVSVARTAVVQALLAAGTVELPAQPVACALATGKRMLATEFTLAPSVSFFGGEAVAASPGIDNLKGLPPSLAAVLKRFVNESPLVEEGLVRAINHFLEERQEAR